MKQIVTEEDVASVLTEPLAVLYKHSSRCPTSSLAYNEIRSLGRLQQDVPVYLLDVIERRALSRYVAERLGVTHASPQAIILRGGIRTWHGSHFEVQADAMARRLEQLKADD